MTAQKRRQCKVMAYHRGILRALANRPTRRNLFGPVDREQLQMEYNDILRRDLEEATHRWNFDFVSEKPLEGGDFQWEGLSAVRVPVLYRSCQMGEHLRHRGGSSDALKENIPNTPEHFTSVSQHTETAPEKKETQKRKQTNITDFYQAKKRLVATPRKSGQ